MVLCVASLTPFNASSLTACGQLWSEAAAAAGHNLNFICSSDTPQGCTLALANGTAQLTKYNGQ